jgi:hypothetical protein
MHYEASAAIAAPIDLVWSTVVDVEHWPESTASVTSVERLDAGPFGVGSHARVRQPRLPTMVWTVTDVQPGREFTWIVKSLGVTTIATHRVTAGPGDQVSLTLSIDRVGLLAPVVDRLWDGLTRRYMAMEAAGVKRVCEASAAALPNVNRFSYSEANY